MRETLVRSVNKGRDAAPRRQPVSPELEGDYELAARMLEGDRDALRLWLGGHLPPVYGYLLRRLGPGREELAEEVAKSTFGVALRRVGPYAKGRARVPMRLWLLRLAGVQLSKRLRKRPVPQVPETEKQGRARRVLAALPTRKQEALYLALAEGLNGAELAAALGLRVPGAMRLLRSALKQADKGLGVAAGIYDQPDSQGERAEE